MTSTIKRISPLFCFLLLLFLCNCAIGDGQGSNEEKRGRHNLFVLSFFACLLKKHSNTLPIVVY